MVANTLDEFQHESFDDNDDGVEFFPYNLWNVDKAVALGDDGVNTSVFLYLGSDSHEFELGIALHPKAAMKLAADLIRVAVEA
jgi:hypothetical protein